MFVGFMVCFIHFNTKTCVTFTPQPKLFLLNWVWILTGSNKGSPSKVQHYVSALRSVSGHLRDSTSLSQPSGPFCSKDHKRLVLWLLLSICVLLLRCLDVHKGWLINQFVVSHGHTLFWWVPVLSRWVFLFFFVVGPYCVPVLSTDRGY